MNIRKIVNGKMYDTNTATELGYYYNAKTLDDYDYRYEGLWKKKNGEMFFLHQGWNEIRITPEVTDEQAREWGAKWLDTEDYIKLFGEPSE